MLDLKVAICDDDKNDLDKLHSILTSYTIAKDTNLHIDTFSNAKDLLTTYKQSKDYQIILLDIEMPNISGMKVAEIIRTTIDRHVIIVFISNYPHYMQDSFKVHPFRYITKPISLQTIYTLLDDIIIEINESQLLYTLVSTEEKMETINIKDILYIEVTDGKRGILCFHFANRSVFIKGTLSTWYDKPKNHNFYQCFRGILVNLLYIHYFDKHTLILNNGAKIPLNRSSEKKLRDMYLNQIVELRKF